MVAERLKQREPITAPTGAYVALSWRGAMARDQDADQRFESVSARRVVVSSHACSLQIQNVS
jgi:hypothetical protein